jgi:hypothetical protein
MQQETAVWAADNGVNIVSVGVVDRVRAITDTYRSRWQAKATPETIMPLLGINPSASSTMIVRIR